MPVLEGWSVRTDIVISYDQFLSNILIGYYLPRVYLHREISLISRYDRTSYTSRDTYLGVVSPEELVLGVF